MKKVFLTMVGLLISGQAFATVDAMTTIYLVARDIQTEEFYLERARIVGCYGIAEGPQLVQFTSEYKVPSNIGCGGEKYEENINYLTCAKLEEKWDENTNKLKELILDISKCDDKGNPDLIQTIRKAVRMNFDYSNPKLTIKK